MPESHSDIHDVAIVGFGPTGQTLAILLAQQGHRVVVVERHAEPFALPRAVVFDSEAGRTLAACGIADRFDEIREVGDDYVWLDAAGDLLLRLPMAEGGPSGWPDANLMTQPRLEQVLAERAAMLPTLTLHRGVEAVQLRQDADAVELTVHGPTLKQKTIRSRYVVGCDGATSFVRDRMDTTVSDLGFFYDWLICDLFLDDQSPWTPMNRQICDPDRPTTLVSGGPGRRRWEFMRMPGDDGGSFDTEENAWRLLKRWGVTPDNANLEKRALYTFQARWVDRWRDGRLMVAGDAAHLMPPFAGQGMCSGIRDSTNLAWKLDLVLRGLSDDALLDSYSTERSMHVRNAIHFSVELGRVICETDPEKVAGRNARLKAAGGRPDIALPALPPPVLGPGVLLQDADGAPIGPAGQLTPQPVLRGTDGHEGLADDIVGRGLRVYVDIDAVGDFTLEPDQELLLKSLPADVVLLSDGSTTHAQSLVDIDRTLLGWLRDAGYGVGVVRPDGYLFGGIASVSDIGSLLDELAHLLRHTSGASRD